MSHDFQGDTLTPGEAATTKTKTRQAPCKHTRKTDALIREHYPSGDRLALCRLTGFTWRQIISRAAALGVRRERSLRAGGRKENAEESFERKFNYHFGEGVDPQYFRNLVKWQRGW